MRVWRGVSGAIAGCAAVAASLMTVDEGAAQAAPVVVHPGQSIQAALNAAAPGTTIVVEAGIYRENLLIEKDGITLRGHGDVRLVRPSSPHLVCGQSATSVSGICVAHVVGFGPTGPITTTVHKVHISGMTIRDFTDSGIFMFDTAGARLDHLHLVNNGGYGAFALSSTGTWMTDSVAVGNNEAGLYVGDSPNADAVITGNTLRGNGIGVFFRDSHRARIADNTSEANCAGIVFLNTGNGTGVGDATAVDNAVNGNVRACPAGDGPPLSGIGIAVIGGDHITLRDNRVTGNVPGGPTFATAGILLAPGPAPTTGINVVENELHHNSTDIVEAAPEPSNHFADNECSTSSPAGLCRER